MRTVIEHRPARNPTHVSAEEFRTRRTVHVRIDFVNLAEHTVTDNLLHLLNRLAVAEHVAGLKQNPGAVIIPHKFRVRLQSQSARLVDMHRKAVRQALPRSRNKLAQFGFHKNGVKLHAEKFLFLDPVQPRVTGQFPRMRTPALRSILILRRNGDNLEDILHAVAQRQHLPVGMLVQNSDLRDSQFPHFH